jgi:hypothetical protein
MLKITYVITLSDEALLDYHESDMTFEDVIEELKCNIELVSDVEAVEALSYKYEKE